MHTLGVVVLVVLRRMRGGGGGRSPGAGVGAGHVEAVCAGAA